MRKLKLVFLITFLFFPLSVFAGMNAPRVVHVAPDEVIDGNFLAAGDQILVEGKVEGDVIVAGGSVVVTGAVAGDVIALGGDVHVSGPVQGNVRAIAGNVLLDGVVGKNASLIAGDIYLSNTSAVGWGLLLLGGNMDLAGTVSKDIRVSAGTVRVLGQVKENMWAKVGSLQLSPQARIGGDLFYASPRAAQVLSGAVVGGEVNFTPIEKHRQAREGAVAAAVVLWLAFLLLKLIAFFCLGWFLLWAVPRLLAQAEQALRAALWLNIGKGIAAFVLVPVLCVILALTVIGMPLAVLFGSILMIAVLSGGVVIAMVLGEPLVKKVSGRRWKHVSPRWSLLAGLLVLGIISAVPFVGGLLIFLAAMAGLGAFLTAGTGVLKRLQ